MDTQEKLVRLLAYGKCEGPYCGLHHPKIIPGLAEHTCPYMVMMKGDTSPCNCCEECLHWCKTGVKQ